MHCSALHGVHQTWFQYTQRAPQSEVEHARTHSTKSLSWVPPTCFLLHRELLPWHCSLQHTDTHTRTHKKVQYSTLVFPFSTHGCGWEGCWGARFQQSGHYFSMAVCLWPIRGHGDWNVTQHFLEGTRQKGHKGCHCMQDTVWKHMADT